MALEALTASCEPTYKIQGANKHLIQHECLKSDGYIKRNPRSACLLHNIPFSEQGELLPGEVHLRVLPGLTDARLASLNNLLSESLLFKYVESCGRYEAWG
jgi:hypothetical protein